MKLMTNELRAVLPPLYSTEKDQDPVVRTKFFDPGGSWTWYVTEYDGEDTFFGVVDGFDVELGYFSLSELESARGRFGLPIERDLHFTPCRVSQIPRLNGRVSR